jgi:hypothetical protein
MRASICVAVLIAGSASAWAQNGTIDVFTSYGPSGTRQNLELPATDFTYQSTVSCIYSFHYDFKVYKNGVLKLSDSFDVIDPGGTYNYSKNVSFSGWNLVSGDVIRYYSFVKIIAGPYTNQTDRDNFYHDCVDLISVAPSMPHRATPYAIDEKRRFEELLG